MRKNRPQYNERSQKSKEREWSFLDQLATENKKTPKLKKIP